MSDPNEKEEVKNERPKEVEAPQLVPGLEDNSPDPDWNSSDDE